MKLLLRCSAASIAILLAACGGGGGGGVESAPPAPLVPAPSPTPVPPPAPLPPPPPITATNFNTSEYRNSNAAVVSGAIAAYDAGATGRGVKAAVIDSGINPSLSEFAGKIDEASRDVTLNGRSLGDEGGHGTAVAGVIAAARDGTWMHGVAFDSTIIALRADTPGSCTDTTDDKDGCSFGDGSIARGIDAAIGAGARVINMSLGGSAPGVQVMNALSRAVGSGVVVVISAGNEGEKPEGVNANGFAAIPASNFPGHVIVAGSVGTLDRTTQQVGATDQLSAFSNRAGNAAGNYLAALGAGVRTIDKEGARTLWSGTSFAAPTISGAVALLASAFPNLSGAQIVDILFRSADDLGPAGTDATFGRGRLNVARAMQPIGGASLAGAGIAVTAGSSSAPGAAGDSTSTGKARLGAIVLDGYSRAFAVDLARTVRAAPQGEPLRKALDGSVRMGGASVGKLGIAMIVADRQRSAFRPAGIGPEDLRRARLIAGSAVARIDDRTAVALGFAEGAKAMERRLSGVDAGSFLIARDVAGHPGFEARRGGAIALRHDLGPIALTLSGESGEVLRDAPIREPGKRYRWTALTIDRNLGRTAFALGVGRLEERSSLLGGRLGPLLGGGGAESVFADLEARRALGAGWSLGISARRGWTKFGGGRFTSGAYGIDLKRSELLSDDDRLGFRLSQPLRIDGGGFAISLPTSFDYATMTPGNSIVRSSLVPRGRELDAELSYGTRALGSGWIGANLYARRQPGHVAAAPTDLGAAVRFSLGF